VLEAWLADLRVDEAVQARARTAWLARQASEEATFVGVLVDLAERERPVLIETTTGRSHRGRLRVVGEDFCCVRTPRRVDVLVSYDAVASLRPAPREPGPAGDRLLAPIITLRAALSALAGTEACVVVTASGGTSLRGELRSVGHDVAVLGLDDGRAAYVRLASVAEVSVVESG
jgi:hypothetical protein